MTDSIPKMTGSSDNLEFDVVDIDENNTWKDEVDRLMKRNAYLEDEAKASQLMAALAFKKHGSIRVPKNEIAQGLPGWGLTIDEDGDDIILGVKQSD